MDSTSSIVQLLAAQSSPADEGGLDATALYWLLGLWSAVGVAMIGALAWFPVGATWVTGSESNRNRSRGQQPSLGHMLAGWWVVAVTLVTGSMACLGLGAWSAVVAEACGMGMTTASSHPGPGLLHWVMKAVSALLFVALQYPQAWSVSRHRRSLHGSVWGSSSTAGAAASTAACDFMDSVPRSVSALIPKAASSIAVLPPSSKIVSSSQPNSSSSILQADAEKQAAWLQPDTTGLTGFLSPTSWLPQVWITLSLRHQLSSLGALMTILLIASQYNVLLATLLVASVTVLELGLAQRLLVQLRLDPCPAWVWRSVLLLNGGLALALRWACKILLLGVGGGYGMPLFEPVTAGCTGILVWMAGCLAVYVFFLEMLSAGISLLFGPQLVALP